jgi:hypothetical protein
MSQHCDCKDSDRIPCGAIRRIQHGGPSGGMNREQIDPGGPGSRHCSLHCVRNVMQLEVQKDPASMAARHLDSIVTPSDESLQAYFQHPNPRTELFAPSVEGGPVRGVESDRHTIERISHLFVLH